MRERTRRPQRAYAAIPNKAMRDTSISMEARGLLALLMTYSDDWVFRRDHLMIVTGWGRDKFSKHMGELRKAGYVELVQDRKESGTLLGNTWIIKDENDRETEIQCLGSTESLKNRPPVKPTSGESGPLRRPETQEDQKERTPIPPEGDLFSGNSDEDEQAPQVDPIAEGFRELWDDIWPKHPRKTGKKDCEKVYRQACTGKHPKSEKIDPGTLNAAAKRYLASVDDHQFLKGLLPWLRLPGWEPFLSDAPAERRRSVETPSWMDIRT